MQQLADFWRYGVHKTWRKAVAATLSPIYARLHGSTDKEPGTFTTRYGVRMIGNWRDRTFRYCMFATYGHDLADILANQPHDFQFVDIGANQGLYSLLAGMNPRCRRIVAFEPVPNTFALLRGNIATNNLADRANLHKLAIAAEAGRTVIKVNEAHSGTASLADQTTYAAKETVTIQTINAAVLDDILGTEWPMIVKVDVEGLEQQVIAELAKARAFQAVSGLFYEIDERWSDASAIQALLVSAGFRIFRRFGRGHHYDVYATR
jgi:FkbM family methyltransferase